MEDFLRYKFEGLISGILQYYKFILATSLKERDIIYTISLNNSQGLGEIIIFFHVIKRQLLEGGNYFKYCSLKV